MVTLTVKYWFAGTLRNAGRIDTLAEPPESRLFGDAFVAPAVDWDGVGAGVGTGTGVGVGAAAGGAMAGAELWRFEPSSSDGGASSTGRSGSDGTGGRSSSPSFPSNGVAPKALV